MNGSDEEAAAVAAIRTGDVPALRRLLNSMPALADARLAEHGGRTPLHVATDWPGHHPHVADTIAALIAAGADPNAAGPGPAGETPLHWAASSDDVAALDALIAGGADVDACGAVIGGGTPMADATAFGQWRAARRLLDHGARTTLWEAAALGLLPRVQESLAVGGRTNQEVTEAFWGACHGGRQATAAHLLAAGAELNWVGWDHLTPLDAAERSRATEVTEWLRRQGARSAAAG